jgi:hypothetical protein
LVNNNKGKYCESQRKKQEISMTVLGVGAIEGNLYEFGE